MLEAILPALVGAGLGAGGVHSWLRVHSQNDRDDAESAKVLAQAYALFTDDLRTELTALRTENGLLRERIAGLEAHISTLLHDARQRERDRLGP